MSLCPHCGQPLPTPKEEIDPGFRVGVMGTTPFNERYDTTRREIESARKDLRGEGWSRLFSALLKLRKLGDEKLGCGIGIPFAK